ncbi:hypothetical protein ACHAXT_006921 [Thalassiosira profunda]
MTPNTTSIKTPSTLNASDGAGGPISSHSSKDDGQRAPKMGPEPTLLSRRQVDALYTLLEAVTNGLKQLDIPYILTGGSLLGAIRQHSILFCDDDIDLAILESDDGGVYERAKAELPAILGGEYQYTVRPWEGGDKVRLKACSNVFLDVFVIRKYESIGDLVEVIGAKQNGQQQTMEYVREIVDTINAALHSQGEVEPSQSTATIANADANAVCLSLSCPIYHFSTRKAIELWPKEVYRSCELFPTTNDLKMGPITRLCGPATPVHLLKRAFGCNCFEVWYQSVSHGSKLTLKNDVQRVNGKRDDSGNDSNLPPLVSPGGQWSQSAKAALSDEHYIPMQPVARAKRRHTLHNKSTLFEYLSLQNEREVHTLKSGGVLTDAESESAAETANTLAKERNRRTVYMDGVFDLFHVGHLNAIQQCAALGDRVIIGVTGDDDASGYKRRPIISESERTAIVKALKVVDDVVCPCPLVVTKDFMSEWDIDLVVHGFANPEDKERQREFFQTAMDEGKFAEISYYSQLSTTDILGRIRAQDQAEASNKKAVNPNWFGAALSAATKMSASIPYDPFPLELRKVIEQQLRKATNRRRSALDAIREATGASIYDQIMSEFKGGKYAEESTFAFDVCKWKLREKFLESCGLASDFDLSRLHEQSEPNFKDEMLFAFAKDHRFHQVYDEFVRTVCCPFVASMSDEPVDELYYQSFPCVRVVRPGDFSIGPHADCNYGHHPSSINFYIPLTKIEGSASLFLESRPGSEDWHPIEGEYGSVKRFAGAICTHWTAENKTDFTRVSLDFRIIPGSMFSQLRCGGKLSGGVRDVYREKEGYYSRSCRSKNGSESTWEREGPLQTPDARFGFPWTKVKTANKNLR